MTVPSSDPYRRSHSDQPPEHGYGSQAPPSILAAFRLIVIVQLITIALGATVLFLLYRPDSSAYYTAMTQQTRL